MMELYRFLMDDFLIQYCQKLGKADFKTRFEDYSPNRKAKREYLNRSLSTDLTRKLSGYFERKVEIPRIRHGSRQTIETLINEEAYLLARFLRKEQPSWIPRISNLP